MTTPNSEGALHEVVTALRESAGAVASSPDVPAEQPFDSRRRSVTACAICRLVERSVLRSLKAQFAELVNDPEMRLRLRRSRGFCRTHTPLLEQYGDALGATILLADLAAETRRRWESGIWAQRASLLGRFLSASSDAPCPACLIEAEADARFVSALAQGLQRSPQVWQEVQQSVGLCVLHIERIAGAASQEDAARLIRIEIEKLARLQSELEEFIRKNDYRFRSEPWGDESSGWIRALPILRKP